LIDTTPLHNISPQLLPNLRIKKGRKNHKHIYTHADTNYTTKKLSS